MISIARIAIVILAGHFRWLYSPAGEMNIFLINACRPLEDCMSPITKITPIPRVIFCLIIIFSRIVFLP